MMLPMPSERTLPSAKRPCESAETQSASCPLNGAADHLEVEHVAGHDPQVVVLDVQ